MPKDLFLESRIRTRKSEGRSNTEILTEISEFHFFDKAKFKKNGDLEVRYSVTKRKVLVRANTLEVICLNRS